MDESVVKIFEEQKLGTLKLSDAIRIGAKLRPQCFGVYATRYGTCAIGAALEATGRAPDQHCIAIEDVAGFFGITQNLIVQVVGKNDVDHMTREEIADWLESIGY